MLLLINYDLGNQFRWYTGNIRKFKRTYISIQENQQQTRIYLFLRKFKL